MSVNATEVHTLQIVIMQMGVGFLFYGVQAALTGAAVTFMARKDIRSRLVIAAVAGLFISSTIEVVANMVFYVAQYPTFRYPPTASLKLLLTRLNAVIVVASRFNYVVSDTVVAWRAWVLWPEHLTVKVILSLCIFCSFAGAIVNCVIELRAPVALPDTYRSFIYTIPVLFTNVVATSLVGVRVWYYRKDVKGLMDLMTRRTRAEKILLLLVEVGFVYCLLWVVYIVMKAIDNPGNSKYAFGVLGNTYHSLTGIYATFIILAVAVQRSATETLRETKFSQALRFADPGTGQDQTTELDASVGTSLTYVHDGQRGESSIDGQSSQEEEYLRSRDVARTDHCDVHE
ncbi:hypothetical protein EV715DRAFT_296186 [Schizophyllum commune]